MPPPPPPPPGPPPAPGPPPPPGGMPPLPKAQDGRGALLKEIEKGKSVVKLRKVQTNDRSAPLVDSKASSPSSSSSSSSVNSGSSSARPSGPQMPMFPPGGGGGIRPAVNGATVQKGKLNIPAGLAGLFGPAQPARADPQPRNESRPAAGPAVVSMHHLNSSTHLYFVYDSATQPAARCAVRRQRSLVKKPSVPPPPLPVETASTASSSSSSAGSYLEAVSIHHQQQPQPQLQEVSTFVDECLSAIEAIYARNEALVNRKMVPTEAEDSAGSNSTGTRTDAEDASERDEDPIYCSIDEYTAAEPLGGSLPVKATVTRPPPPRSYALKSDEHHPHFHHHQHLLTAQQLQLKQTQIPTEEDEAQSKVHSASSGDDIRLPERRTKSSGSSSGTLSRMRIKRKSLTSRVSIFSSASSSSNSSNTNSTSVSSSLSCSVTNSSTSSSSSFEERARTRPLISEPILVVHSTALQAQPSGPGPGASPPLPPQQGSAHDAPPLPPPPFQPQSHSQNQYREPQQQQRPPAPSSAPPPLPAKPPQLVQQQSLGGAPPPPPPPFSHHSHGQPERPSLPEKPKPAMSGSSSMQDLHRPVPSAPVNRPPQPSAPPPPPAKPPTGPRFASSDAVHQGFATVSRKSGEVMMANNRPASNGPSVIDRPLPELPGQRGAPPPPPPRHVPATAAPQVQRGPSISQPHQQRAPSAVDSLEARFQFKPIRDLPPPDRFVPCERVYPSRANRSARPSFSAQTPVQ